MMPELVIYVILPQERQYEDVFDAVLHATSRAAKGTNSHPMVIMKDALPPHREGENLADIIASASLVIADTTGAEPNVLYELGLVQSLGKPLILNHQDDDLIPSILSEYQTLLYDRSRLTVDLVPRLGAAMAGILGFGPADSLPAQQGNGRDASASS